MNKYEQDLQKLVGYYEERIEQDKYFLGYECLNKYAEPLEHEIYLCEQVIDNMTEMVQHFNKLTQSGSILDYLRLIKSGVIALLWHARYRVHRKMYL